MNFKKLIIALAGVISLLGLWSIFVEPQLLIVNRFNLESSKWPETHPYLKIGVIADLHIGSPFFDLERLDEIVAKTNKEQPDIVVLLGDYVSHLLIGGSSFDLNLLAAGLGRLKTRHGVYAVLGNHDWWDDGILITKALQGVGIQVLENEISSFRIQGQQVSIVGLADSTTRSPDPVGTVEKTGDEPVIVIAHDPAVFFDVPAKAVITLAGHMHGGQVAIPFIGSVVSVSQAPLRWAKGYIREWGKDLFVSSGLGTSILPIRFNVPPEIVIMTLAGLPRKKD